MMEKEYYTCQFCQTKFIPKRRKITKFCSNSCRVKNHYHKNNIKSETDTIKPEFVQTQILEKMEELKVQLDEKTKIEQMSASGFGNAMAGSLAADGAKALAKSIFTNIKNNPATKGDLEELKELINTRFFVVHNIRTDAYGRMAYYDMSTSKIVYYNENTDSFEFPQFDL